MTVQSKIAAKVGAKVPVKLRAQTRAEIRTRILQYGFDVASAEGLQAVTVGELARELHVPRSGLFTMFSTREKLQLAILDQAIERFKATVIAPAKLLPQGQQRVEALFRNWLSWARSAHLKGGCLFVNASSKTDTLGAPISNRLDQALKQWREELLSTIEDAKQITGASGLRNDLDSEQFVFELFGLYLSHHHWHWSMHDSNAQWRTLKAFQRLMADARL